ncbi:hypothetical protein [Priestia koreensis]|uniref:hypothetical protein n=1 Tax=Priestia koreensis TaxID=284581 RepID=UPI00301AC784
MKRVLFVLLLLLSITNVGNAASLQDINVQLNQKEALITFFHLKNGEATLLQDGFGKAILVNTGGEGSSRELYSHLRAMDVNRVDTIIVTKEESPYNANVSYFCKRLHPEQVYRTVPKDGVTLLKDQQSLPLSTKLHLQVIKTGNDGADLLIEFGQTKLIYMSTDQSDVDLEKSLQKVSIIKVPHFGEKPLGEPFLKMTDPHAAIIFHQSQRQPNAELLEQLSEHWIDVYQLAYVSVAVKLKEDTYQLITLPK